MKDADIIMKNLERTKHGLPIAKRAKDTWIKGLQLQWCYEQHWNEVREIFDKYKIDLRHQSPIITIQTLKEVRLAMEITEKIKKDEHIREMASSVSYPLRNAYPTPNIKIDDLIDGTIFIVVLRLIPQLSLEIGRLALDNFFNNGNREKYLSELFKSHGTILETQRNFEDTVKHIITELNTNVK